VNATQVKVCHHVLVPDPMIEMFVRFTHLDKEFDYLPGMTPAVMAQLLGLDFATYQRLREEHDAAARQAASGLLTDPEFAARVGQLPFDAGQTVVAIGDSITDDLQGWLEILRHLLDIRGDAPAFVNLGRAAYTSAMALRRLAPQLGHLRPDWVLCMLGNGDMSRVGGELQTSVDETERVLRVIRSLGGDTRWVWLTPVPVHEEHVAAFTPFSRGLATWRNDDIVALGDRIRAFPDPVVDVQEVYGVPPKPDYQGPDGVHPTLAGQTATARALVERLVP
jgi:acyl-CoA thioesterase I